MALTEAVKTEASVGHVVTAGPQDSITILLPNKEGIDGEHGQASEWVDALRRFRRDRRDLELVTRSLSCMLDVAQLWAKEHPWVEQIGVLFPKESDRAVTLVVVAQPETTGTQELLAATTMGLALGGVLKLTVEPRLVEGKIQEVPGWMLAYQKGV
jgi:hypothetical protein